MTPNKTTKRVSQDVARAKQSRNPTTDGHISTADRELVWDCDIFMRHHCLPEMMIATWGEAMSSIQRVPKTDNRLRRYAVETMGYEKETELIAFKVDLTRTPFCSEVFIEYEDGEYFAQCYGDVVRDRRLEVVASVLWASTIEEMERGLTEWRQRNADKV